MKILKSGKLDPKHVLDLYTAVGWNQSGQRTLLKTEKMLEQSLFYVQAYVDEKLIGFGRILGDVYVAQILDIMVHPDHRKKGIATQILNELMSYIDANYESAFLIDGTGFSNFYSKHGFKTANSSTDRLMYYKRDRSI